MPLLSIITVNRNNAEGLRKTIKSVIDQTFSDFEYIIIDGGSTDGSVDVIKEFSNKISYWISEPDRGIFNAMNKGISKAQGKYIQFLNSGDWLLSKTTLQTLFSVDYNADILYGDANYVYEDETTKLYQPGREEEITLAYFYSHTLSHQAAFFSKKLFVPGGYDENFKIVSDWKFFIDRIIFQNCSIHKINLVIVNFDMSGIGSQKESKLHKAERDKVISQLVPDRIAKDYNKLAQVLDSPLLEYLPFLNKTTRFHKFIAKMIGVLIKIYKPFKT